MSVAVADKSTTKVAGNRGVAMHPQPQSDEQRKAAGWRCTTSLAFKITGGMLGVTLLGGLVGFFVAESLVLYGAAAGFCLAIISLWDILSYERQNVAP